MNPTPNHTLLLDPPQPSRPAWRLRPLACALALLGTSLSAQSAVLISQVYGGGGNSGAVYKHDFIELRNTGSTEVDLTGWSLQYAATAGVNWSAKTLSGKIPAGGFYLVRLATGNATIGADLPVVPDETSTINMAIANGKVVLRNTSTQIAQGTSCPVGEAATVDFVGYGTANCAEGAAAPAATSAAGLLRDAAGGYCADTNVNRTDFSLAGAGWGPRNSASAALACGSGSGNGNGGGTTPPPTPPSATDMLIPAIQGSAARSPVAGTVVRTRGVVTLVSSNGFFMQDAAGDGNAATSDGIFVFTGSSLPAAAVLGNLVEVVGKVTEYSAGSSAAGQANPLTELAELSSVTQVSTGHTVQPTAVSLPETVEGELERYEGMLVTIAGQLTVQQNAFQSAYGQLTLAAGGRLETPTNRHAPGSAQAIALADENARRRIVLDDGRSSSNPNPTPHLPASGVLRAGDQIAALTGVLDHGLVGSSASGPVDYRLQPTVAPVISASNPRSALPPAWAGNLSVASMNVLNYFTTFTNGQTADGATGQGCSLGSSSTAGNCRGANNAAEFNRQRAKIVAALSAMNADVVALMEIQNNGLVAVNNLVAALNQQVGAGTYASTEMPAGLADTAPIGTDAIRTALIYKPARVATVGKPVVDMDAVNNRPTFAQALRTPNGETFTVLVNHFKSKGSCPSANAPDAAGNTDSGDGQGCWNATRTAQARRLASFVAGLPTSTAAQVLLLGDLNAYAQEQPITTLASSGYTDLLGRTPGLHYSYVFDGMAGRLDHALANSTLAAKVVQATHWHINADEGVQHDYNLEDKPPACATCAPDPWAATPYRSSDHDPVLLSLGLYKTLAGGAGRDAITGTAGDDILLGGPGADTLTGGAGADTFVYTTLRDAGDLITDFAPGQDRIDLRALLASLNLGGANALANGVVKLVAAGSDVQLLIDADGSAGAGLPRALLTLKNLALTSLAPSRDLILF